MFFSHNEQPADGREASGLRSQFLAAKEKYTSAKGKTEQARSLEGDPVKRQYEDILEASGDINSSSVQSTYPQNMHKNLQDLPRKMLITDIQDV